VHQFPAGPPLSVRVRAALRGCARAAGSVFSLRTRRAVPVLVVGMAVGVIALAVPVLSAGGAPVWLDSSSTNSTAGTVPVRLGVDGAPAGTGSSVQQRAPGTTSGTGAGTGAAAARTGATDARVPAGSAAPAGTAASAPAPTGPSAAASSAARAASGAPSSASSAAQPALATPSSAPSPGPASPPPPPSDPSPGPSADAPVPPAIAPFQAAVLDLVNAARDDAGCDPLSRDGDLAAAARDNSAAMAAQGAAAVLDEASTAAAVSAGEPDAGSVVRAWLADDTDREALIDCSRTSAGVGEVDADGGPWWTIFLD
jgi:uncharacterized protein YkwD